MVLGHETASNFSNVDFEKGETDLVPPKIVALEMGERTYATTIRLEKTSKDVSFVLIVGSANEEPVVNRFVIEIMDERGVPVISPFISSDQNLDKNGSERSHSLTFDKVLSDGYYFAKATAFFADVNSIAGVAESETYFSSINGELSNVSEKEWNENSLTNVAMKNVEGEKSRE